MDYFKILNLRTEPFSNSPDPAFFYRSEEHIACLQKLELAVRLRRGLNVIIGDIGTGKTTLSRQFILQHNDDENLEIHLILDPSFSSPIVFLTHITSLFGLPESDTEWQLKENIKNYLFKKGVDDGKNIIVVIDEGQKIPEFCLEILREFMNYETNEFKLLQVIIFAQNEFREIMEKHANFADRVNICAYLNPLSFKETKALINFRLKQASEGGRMPSLFTLPAYWSIFKLSGGRPRKIIQLCHKLLLSMIIQNRSKISSAMVKACFHATELSRTNKAKWAAVIIGVAVLIFAAIFSLNLNWKEQVLPQAGIQDKSQPAPSLSIQKSEAVSSPEPIVKVDPKPERVKGKLLGKVTIARGETVNSLIRSIYGKNTGNIFREFADANPGIKNFNHVLAGQEISFPQVRIHLSDSVVRMFWVKYGEFDQLEKAYLQYKKFRRDKIGVKLINFSDDSGNLKFTILSDKGFANEDAARRILNLSGIPGTSIIKLNKNNIYYSDMG